MFLLVSCSYGPFEPAACPSVFVFGGGGGEDEEEEGGDLHTHLLLSPTLSIRTLCEQEARYTSMQWVRREKFNSSAPLATGFRRGKFFINMKWALLCQSRGYYTCVRPCNMYRVVIWDCLGGEGGGGRTFSPLHLHFLPFWKILFAGRRRSIMGRFLQSRKSIIHSTINSTRDSLRWRDRKWCSSPVAGSLRPPTDLLSRVSLVSMSILFSTGLLKSMTQLYK